MHPLIHIVHILNIPIYIYIIVRGGRGGGKDDDEGAESSCCSPNNTIRFFLDLRQSEQNNLKTLGCPNTGCPNTNLISYIVRYM